MGSGEPENHRQPRRREAVVAADAKSLASMKVILFWVAAAAFAQRSTDIESFLARIAVYEYGQSREPLARFTRSVEQSLGSPARLQEIEARLLIFLQSNATPAGKDFV